MMQIGSLRRLREEDGFTMVEAIVSITVLAVGALAVAQAITFGLDTSGLARQRLAARAGIEQQMELARALNYETLVLDDADPLPGSIDPDNPDFWIDEALQTFDPDGDGPLAAEAIVREAGAQPALHHFQSPVVQGNTTFTVYLYITWVDADDDGLGTADEADGNGDGEFDGDGQDGKRVVVTVTWPDTLSDTVNSSRSMSLFTADTVPYHESGVASNLSPDVSCPTVVTYSDLSYDLLANAVDLDGTVTSIDWHIVDRVGNDFDETWLNQGTTLHVDFPDDDEYWITNTVTDDGASSADNDTLNCAVTASTTSNDATGNGGPPGTVVVSGGATNTNQTQVTLTLTCPLCVGGSKMQFSTDGSTWTSKTDFSTSALFTMTSGDGLKTVYARFWKAGKYGPFASDTITLDQTAPNGPTGLYKVSSANSGQNKTVVIQWTLPSPASADEAGRTIWTRPTTSTGSFTQTTCTVVTTNRCSMVLLKHTNYSVYVTYYDTSGNQSVASDTITV